jgi:hypothetical protein
VEHGVDLTVVPANGVDIDAVNLGQYQINARDFFLATQVSAVDVFSHCLCHII